MESTVVLPLFHLPFSSPKHNTNKANYYHPSWPPKQRASPSSTRLNCHKMYVPGFGEASPEAKAARNLHNFFNFVAVKIVSAQLQSYNPEAYQELMEFMERHSLNDGDQFCASLMRESLRHKSLAMRILEVRSAYCKQDFEWDNLQRLAIKMVDESNTSVMKHYVLETSSIKAE